MIEQNEKDLGLSKSEKIKIFFFGLFIVIITGTNIFYSLPYNKSKKKQILWFYILGLLFWIIISLTLYYLLHEN